MTARKVRLVDVRTRRPLRDLIDMLEEQQRAAVEAEQREQIEILKQQSRDDFALRVRLEDRITDLERRLGNAEAAAS